MIFTLCYQVYGAGFVDTYPKTCLAVGMTTAYLVGSYFRKPNSSNLSEVERHILSEYMSGHLDINDLSKDLIAKYTKKHGELPKRMLYLVEQGTNELRVVNFKDIIESDHHMAFLDDCTGLDTDPQDYIALAFDHVISLISGKPINYSAASKFIKTPPFPIPDYVRRDDVLVGGKEFKRRGKTLSCVTGKLSDSPIVEAAGGAAEPIIVDDKVSHDPTSTSFLPKVTAVQPIFDIQLKPDGNLFIGGGVNIGNVDFFGGFEYKDLDRDISNLLNRYFFTQKISNFTIDLKNGHSYRIHVSTKRLSLVSYVVKVRPIDPKGGNTKFEERYVKKDKICQKIQDLIKQKEDSKVFP